MDKLEANMLNIKDFGFEEIGIEISCTCNFKCKYCILPLRHDAGNCMPTQNIYSILDILKVHGVQNLRAFI
jgi:sulfatase maturation enzyme AslB (radical SAM superfamily)